MFRVDTKHLCFDDSGFPGILGEEQQQWQGYVASVIFV
jgi:hypothetical protein